MRKSFIFFTALACCLLGSAPIQAETEARWLNAEKPVQVRIHEAPRDHNHDEAKLQRALTQRAAESPGRSKTRAQTKGYQLPVRRGLSNDTPGLTQIAAFVDHDELNPDSLLDWNCGERTYDTTSFNHNGTDFNAAVYPWLTMANDGMVVIAVADGVIIDKHDGEFDQNCAFDPSSESNVVVVEHDDGKVAIYAHLKKNSVTPRKVGDRVEQGDYLGVMGSSGLSTGPHLHLGIQDRFGTLYDPYAGTCNALNGETLWEEQEPYKVRDIQNVATHSAPPSVPACPQPEVPNLKDVFTATDTIFASVTARDFDNTVALDIEVLDPSKQAVLSTTYSIQQPGDFPAVTVVFNFTLGNTPADGEYVVRASYEGKTMEHSFYIGAGPDPDPPAVPANNAYTGLWYDPALDGEGFNIVATDGGTIVYFYGSDNRGNRVWLISALIPGAITNGKAIEVEMFESSGGVFPTPVASARGLASWGTLVLEFTACDAGRSTLNGVDGTKVSQITKLAGVAGASCVPGETPADAPWAGLWYDPAKDGEGYNLIVSPIGRILYFYGFKADGLRLWLVSALITDTLEAGQKIVASVFESTQGTFNSPGPSDEALVEWGTVEITVIDCTTVTVVLKGVDGTKTSNTVRLAGIIGTGCPS